MYAVLVAGVPNLLLGLTVTFTAYMKPGDNGVDNLEESLDGIKFVDKQPFQTFGNKLQLMTSSSYVRHRFYSFCNSSLW